MYSLLGFVSRAARVERARRQAALHASQSRKNGLAQAPEQWIWGRYRSHAYGEEGLVRLNQWPKAELKFHPVPSRENPHRSVFLSAANRFALRIGCEVEGPLSARTTNTPARHFQDHTLPHAAGRTKPGRARVPLVPITRPTRRALQRLRSASPRRSTDEVVAA
jgi:hypothetical protein